MYKNDGLRWYHEGIAELSSSAVVEFGKERVIEVSVDSHALLRVNGEEVNGIEHNQVLDLSDAGERWEGDVLNNKPYGWGVLYDSEGKKAYEGFRIGEVNVCYGTRYYSDIQKVEYKGEWCEGKRWGRGIQYDRNGNTVFDGEWMDDDPHHTIQSITMTDKNQLLLSTIEQLHVSKRSCNGEEWTSLDLSPLLNLQLLEVGDNCFKNVKEMTVVGLPRLKKLTIGKKCFGGLDNKEQGSFVLKDCPELTEVHIGNESFLCYTVCVIEHLDALERIRMGGSNYRFASLELISGAKRA